MAKTVNDGDLIKLLIECRTDRGISQVEAGKAIGISGVAISNLERGMAKPRRTTRLKLERFLRRHGYFPKEMVAA